MNEPHCYRVPERLVEAIQVEADGANLAALVEFCPSATVNFYGKIGVYPYTGETAGPGDWIVRNEDDSFTVWPHDDFDATFEEVEPT